MLNKAFYIILFLSLSCCVQAQKIMRNTSLLNYQRGDRTVLHFGFSLGINYMDYKAVLSGANGWRAESGKLDVGFLVGIVSELRLGDDWGLRFLPGLEFATCSLVYTQVPEVENNKQYAYNESVYVSLPLMLNTRPSGLIISVPLLLQEAVINSIFKNTIRSIRTSRFISEPVEGMFFWKWELVRIFTCLISNLE